MINSTVIAILIPLLVGLAGSVYGVYFQKKIESGPKGKSIYPNILSAGLLISAIAALLLAIFFPKVNFLSYLFEIRAPKPFFLKTAMTLPPPVSFWSAALITAAVVTGAHLHTTVDFFRRNMSYAVFAGRKVKRRWADVIRPVEYLTWAALAVGFFKLSHVVMWPSSNQSPRVIFLAIMMCLEFIFVLFMVGTNPHRPSRSWLFIRPYFFNLFINQPVAALLATFTIWL